MINHRNAAFVQLLVAVVVVSVLFGLCIQRIQHLQSAASHRALIANLHMIDNALTLYETDYGPIPQKLSPNTLLKELMAKGYIQRLPQSPFHKTFILFPIHAEDSILRNDLQYSVQPIPHAGTGGIYKAVLGSYTREEWQEYFREHESSGPL